MNTTHAHRMNFLQNTFCGRFISGSRKKVIHRTTIKKRQRYLEDQVKHSFTHYNNLSCSQFNNKSGFYSKKITNLEHENPMAFAILAYKHPYQFRVLMRTLYVRTNLHCIHVDLSAPAHLHAYALKLSTCLENVYLVDTRIEVKWGHISILEAERLCQRLLLNQSSAWHYYMLISVRSINRSFSYLPPVSFRVLNCQFKLISIDCKSYSWLQTSLESMSHLIPNHTIDKDQRKLLHLAISQFTKDNIIIFLLEISSKHFRLIQ